MEQQVKFPELNWMKEKRKSPVYRPVRVEEDQRQSCQTETIQNVFRS